MGKKYKNNSVKGSQRGKKYPPQVRTAAVCDLLLTDNLSDVAKKYNVPESTLRTWQKKAETEEKNGTANIWAKARADCVREITYKASQSARMNLDLIAKRLEIGQRNLMRQEEIDALLYDAAQPSPSAELLIVDGEVVAQQVILPEVLEQQLRKEKNDRHTISDFALTNFARTLTSISKAGALETQESAPSVVSVVLSGEAAELAR